MYTSQPHDWANSIALATGSASRGITMAGVVIVVSTARNVSDGSAARSRVWIAATVFVPAVMVSSASSPASVTAWNRSRPDRSVTFVRRSARLVCMPNTPHGTSHSDPSGSRMPRCTTSSAPNGASGSDASVGSSSGSARVRSMRPRICDPRFIVTVPAVTARSEAMVSPP